MAAAVPVCTGWKVGEFRNLADQMKAAVADYDEKRVVTWTVSGDSVSRATKNVITVTVNGVSTVLKG